jgi:hypothetical protein
MLTQGDAERGSAEGKLKISIEVRLCTAYFADVLAHPVLLTAEIEIVPWVRRRKTRRWFEKWSLGVGCAELGEIR